MKQVQAASQMLFVAFGALEFGIGALVFSIDGMGIIAEIVKPEGVSEIPYIDCLLKPEGQVQYKGPCSVFMA